MNQQNINADKTMLRVGSTLQMGKYRIEKYLSSGGFGNTYMGINVFDEQVAIKEFFMKDVNQRVDDSTAVSLSNITQMPIFQEQMEKFKKEAKRLRNLHSPHIVAVSDLFDENGTTYYVMDYIDGQSLRDMVQQRGKLVEQEVLDYLNQTLDALEVVHNQGIFHLDLKPANLMVDKKGILRIIDFGASKQQKSDGGATSRSAICYSPGYAPIEQKDQEFQNFGPWTDLYALGATLYNVLTGKTPPSTSKISDFGEKAFEFPPTVSKKMQELVIWMMKGRRFDRPQSVADVRKYLKVSFESKRVSVSPPPVKEDPDGDETILTGFEPQHQPEPKPNPKPEPKPKPQPESVTPPKPKPKPKPQPELDSDENKSGMKKWVKIGVAVVAVLILAIILMPKTDPNSQLGVAEEVETVLPDSVQDKAFTNKVLGDYLYTGTLNADGQPDGIGKARFTKHGEPDGRIYQGPFVGGKFEGEDCMLQMENGDVFKGSFKNNYFEEGTYTQAVNGEYFKGIFSNGQPSIGAWYSKDGKKIQDVNIK